MKKISSKWEITSKWEPERGEFRRARWLCREFATGAPTFEYFAPQTSHIAARVVDTVALAKNIYTWTLDVSSAYLHAHEDEEVYVGPPEEWLEEYSLENPNRRVMWQMLRILNGRRKGAKAWMQHAAVELKTLEAHRCEAAPALLCAAEYQ